MSLASIVAHYAALLVPGWKVTCSILPPEKMPIKGALAVCDPTPTRSIAHVYVVNPWPPSESLIETIAHELTHACLSPLTSMLKEHPASIMIEEQAVENIGKALAQVPMGTARAMARAVTTYAPQLRARLRISALAGRARSGGKMDAGMVKAALDAIESGDGEKCKELLKSLLASEASEEGEGGGDAMPGSGAKMPANQGAGGAAVGEGAPMGRAMARLAALTKDAEHSTATLRQSAIRARLHEARAIDGATITPEAEKLILAANTLEDAEIRLTLARGNTGTERARSEVKVRAKEGDGPDLEGLSAREVAMYHSLSKDPESATAYAKEAQRLRARKVASEKGAAS